MSEHDFDIAVSFAGEDRAFVEEVVRLAKVDGYRVFYDEDYQHEMWGEELTEFFPDVYERRSRYVVMFISRHYAAKAWTRVERRSVLARAMNQDSTYLLPVKLDSTALPGVRESVGYLDGLRSGPDGIARAIAAKLRGPQSHNVRQFNGLTPRTLGERAILLGERPPAWEYLLFAYHLVDLLERESVRSADHDLGFAIPRGYVADEAVYDFVNREKAHVLADMDVLEGLLLGPAQGDAMGAVGVAGNPKKIEHLAQRIIMVYSDLLDWATRVRGTAAQSDEARNLLRAFSNYSNQPVRELREFVSRYRDLTDTLTAKLRAGDSIAVDLPIEFDVPEDVSQSVRLAMDDFSAHIARSN